MATYKYEGYALDGSVDQYLQMQYNITPDYNPLYAGNPPLTPGVKVTVTGRVRSDSKAIKSIGVYTTINNGLGKLLGMRAYANINGTKGKWTTFTLTYTYGLDYWQAAREAMAGSTEQYIHTFVFFVVGTKTMNAAQLNNSNWISEVMAGLASGYGDVGTDGGGTQHDMYCTDPTAPTISTTPVITDEASTSALTILGNIVTMHSHPRVSGAWAYDSHYPDQLGHVTLALSGAMTGTYEKDVGSGVTAAAFDLPVPTQAGTVSWVYTVTDMFGNVATATGSFEVLSYAKPYITTCAFERYQEVQTDTGFEHEASPSGEYIWLNLDANIAAVNSRNAWTATLTAWRKERPEIAPTAGSAVYENTTGERRTVSTWALAGSDGQHIQLARDEDNLSDEMVLSAAFDWCLRLTLTDALGNSVTLLVDDDIRKDSAILDVGPYGVSVGARSTALAADPQFECSYPATFYGNVAVPANGLLKVVQLSVLASTSIAAGGYKYDTFTIAQSAIGDGWTPVGVVGHVINNRYISVYNMQVRTENPMQMTYGLYNGSSAARATTLSVSVLCIRTSL